jgi:hypothetical protein
MHIFMTPFAEISLVLGNISATVFPLDQVVRMQVFAGST